MIHCEHITKLGDNWNMSDKKSPVETIYILLNLGYQGANVKGEKKQCLVPGLNE